MNLIIFISLLISILLLSLLLLIWPKKWQIGVNFSRVYCPDCGEKMPLLRVPKSLREILYGGWSCNSCGCEMDKYGKKTTPRDS